VRIEHFNDVWIVFRGFFLIEKLSAKSDIGMNEVRRALSISEKGKDDVHVMRTNSEECYLKVLSFIYNFCHSKKIKRIYSRLYLFLVATQTQRMNYIQHG